MAPASLSLGFRSLGVRVNRIKDLGFRCFHERILLILPEAGTSKPSLSQDMVRPRVYNPDPGCRGRFPELAESLRDDLCSMAEISF